MTRYMLYRSQHMLAKRDFLCPHPQLLRQMIKMFQTQPLMNWVEELCCTSAAQRKIMCLDFYMETHMSRVNKGNNEPNLILKLGHLCSYEGEVGLQREF